MFVCFFYFSAVSLFLGIGSGKPVVPPVEMLCTTRSNLLIGTLFFSERVGAAGGLSLDLNLPKSF